MLGRTRLTVPVVVGTGLLLLAWSGECRAQARVNRGNTTPSATVSETPAAPAAPAAEARPAPGGQATPGQPPQPGGGLGAMFNDPVNRLRMLRARVTGEGMGGFGGRGGRGGGGPGGGQPTQPGGLALISMLGDSPALQEEIGLTDEQKASLNRVQSQARDRRNEAFRQMRENRGQDRQQSFTAMQEMAQQSDSAIDGILTEDQKRRLWEIELQIVGVTGVARPDVMPKLNLSPGQQQQIAAILQQMKATQDQTRQALRDEMAAMFGRGRGGQAGGPQGGPGGFQGGPGGFQGGPGGPPQAGPGGFAGRGGQQGDPGQAQQPGQPGQPGGRGGFDREQMAARMQKIADDEDRIRKMAEQAIAKALTAKQKERFNELLGKPFDLLSLVQPPQRDQNRGGGPPGAGAPNDNAPAATPTANRPTQGSTR